VYFSSTLTAIPHIKSGRLKAIGITGRVRAAALPEVSTFGELGLSGLDEVGTWHGVLAPADPTLTPPSNTPLGKPHGTRHSAMLPKSVCI